MGTGFYFSLYWPFVNNLTWMNKWHFMTFPLSPSSFGKWFVTCGLWAPKITKTLNTWWISWGLIDPNSTMTCIIIWRFNPFRVLSGSGSAPFLIASAPRWTETVWRLQHKISFWLSWSVPSVLGYVYGFEMFWNHIPGSLNHLNQAWSGVDMIEETQFSIRELWKTGPKQQQPIHGLHTLRRKCWTCVAKRRDQSPRRNGSAAISGQSGILFDLDILSGWWFQPLWNILVKWDDYSKYMGK